MHAACQPQHACSPAPAPNPLSNVEAAAALLRHGASLRCMATVRRVEYSLLGVALFEEASHTRRTLLQLLLQARRAWGVGARGRRHEAGSWQADAGGGASPLAAAQLCCSTATPLCQPVAHTRPPPLHPPAALLQHGAVPDARDLSDAADCDMRPELRAMLRALRARMEAAEGPGAPLVASNDEGLLLLRAVEGGCCDALEARCCGGGLPGWAWGHG